MEKLLVFGCSLVLILLSCRSDKSTRINELEVTIDDEMILLGEVDRNAFKLDNYKSWFDSTYQVYVPITKVLDSLKVLVNDIEIKVVMGSWCSDSQRDIPALYRILDQIGYNSSRLSIVATDRNKTLPEFELKSLDIEYVPTIIVYRNNQELGRIVEIPNRTLEEDLWALLKK